MWKRIVSVHAKANDLMAWRPGKGQVYFWWVEWLFTEQPHHKLFFCALNPLITKDWHLELSDWMNPDGSWIREKLREVVPAACTSTIFLNPCKTNSAVVPMWKLSHNGTF